MNYIDEWHPYMKIRGKRSKFNSTSFKNGVSLQLIRVNKQISKEYNNES